ncbi:hypothetical protein MIND_01314300 [Mycena indigotica]|uniref:CxC5 like cysteine cluster associated with KDZ domain-containing protein n=1 Tax=Mycena indigotica TaxID=2126181 RepID=A0A8H6S124_9AGAR|nr:uncharacterized protein MIND_01314300 [Mycena indigotica]KAF7290736.1 hypothetical protein MIND_01314300 [Mycena indigotica]
MSQDTLLTSKSSDSSSLAHGLSLQQTFVFINILARLKNDIFLVQPSSFGNEDCAPSVLPPSILAFTSDALGIDEGMVESLWLAYKEEIWGWPASEPTDEEEKLFHEHGWKRGLTSLVLYPPTHFCDNPACGRQSPLKKATSRQVVVYTLARGVLPAYEIKLYCPNCFTTYFPDFSVLKGIRTYYAIDEIPGYIQVGAHQFIEKRLVTLWITMMLVAWVSGTNCSRIYDLALSQVDNELFEAGGWQFGCVLTTNHIWDAFTLYTLLDYHRRRNTRLVLPHTGLQKDRMTMAMEARNEEVIQRGFEETLGHEDIQVVVTDGLAIGHPRCREPHCTIPLNSNQDRFCPTHAFRINECAVVGCNHHVRSGYKTCDNSEHIEMEDLHTARGQAAFTLRNRLNRHRTAHPHDIVAGDSNGDHWVSEDAIQEDDEWTQLRGRRKQRAHFSRAHTHNEQTLVFPCGLIASRATFYEAEAVSNVLVFVEKAYSVPHARKPHHLIYDSNCDAAQQVAANEDWSWFDDIGMFVDVFHFKNKHDASHTFCQENCNPADCPHLMDGDKWYFNTSVAEQMNVWLGGYLAIVREMLPVKYNFFLNEMIRLHNHITLQKLEDGGHNVRVLPPRGPLPSYNRRRI